MSELPIEVKQVCRHNRDTLTGLANTAHEKVVGPGKQRDYFTLLYRRYEYLGKQIKAKRYSDKSFPYLRQERAALGWTMTELADKFPQLAELQTKLDAKAADELLAELNKVLAPVIAAAADVP